MMSKYSVLPKRIYLIASDYVLLDLMLLLGRPIPHLLGGWRECSIFLVQHNSFCLFTGQEWAEWGVTQLQLATIDFNNAPSQEMLWKGVGFIEKMNTNSKSVYVHCKAGRGRSTTLVACYLMKVESTMYGL